jgi:invasion protein IalB
MKRISTFTIGVTIALAATVAAIAVVVGDAGLPTEAHAASETVPLVPTPQEKSSTQITQATSPQSTLPGGANSLQESFQDWSIVCAQQGATKRCSMSQQQSNAQTKQRVLAIELATTSPDKGDGILVLPFGLALDNGVTLQIDDGGISAPMRFKTCVAAGCLVPISFDARTIAGLRKATTLKIKAMADGGTETPFSISLKGFGSAFDRIISLGR